VGGGEYGAGAAGDSLGGGFQLGGAMPWKISPSFFLKKGYETMIPATITPIIAKMLISVVSLAKDIMLY
jgi:hypothetical protein